MRSELRFVWGWFSAQDDLKKGLDALREALFGRRARQGSDLQSAVLDELAIEGKEGLLRDGRFGPFGGTSVGVGDIESAHQGRDDIAIDKAVDTSSCRLGVGFEIDGPTSLGQVQFARDPEHRIAHGFVVESSSGHSPEQVIFWIDRPAMRILDGTLAIHLGGEDLAVEPSQ